MSSYAHTHTLTIDIVSIHSAFFPATFPSPLYDGVGVISGNKQNDDSDGGQVENERKIIISTANYNERANQPLRIVELIVNRHESKKSFRLTTTTTQLIIKTKEEKATIAFLNLFVQFCHSCRYRN